MDYLTQYYKNRTVQLQEEVVRLTTLVEATNVYQQIINYYTQQYGTYALYLAAVAAGHVTAWWNTITPWDVLSTGLMIAAPAAALPSELLDVQGMGEWGISFPTDKRYYNQAIKFAAKHGYPKPTMEEWIAAGRPVGEQLPLWFFTTYPSDIEQIPGVIDHQLEYEPMGPPSPTAPTSTPSIVPNPRWGGHQMG
jgi:hypothetical protein